MCVLKHLGWDSTEGPNIQQMTKKQCKKIQIGGRSKNYLQFFKNGIKCFGLVSSLKILEWSMAVYKNWYATHTQLNT